MLALSTMLWLSVGDLIECAITSKPATPITLAIQCTCKYLLLYANKYVKLLMITGKHINFLQLIKRYSWFPASSVTFLMLCWTHILCLSSSFSLYSRRAISDFSVAMRSGASTVVHDRFAPLYKHTFQLILGQLSLASLRSRLIEYQLRLG